MTVEFYSVDTPASDIDRKLSEMTDGSFQVVAVEIFDHPTTRYSKLIGAEIGPWIVGPSTEVYEWLVREGHEDFEEQYSAGPSEEE